MIAVCPKCGGTALLLQTKDAVQQLPDLDNATGKVLVPIKVEEYRCQEPSCEHEFEEIVREPLA